MQRKVIEGEQSIFTDTPFDWLARPPVAEKLALFCCSQCRIIAAQHPMHCGSRS